MKPMTVTEAAEHYGVMRYSIYNWIKAGKLTRDVDGVHGPEEMPPSTGNNPRGDAIAKWAKENGHTARLARIYLAEGIIAREGKTYVPAAEITAKPHYALAWGNMLGADARVTIEDKETPIQAALIAWEIMVGIKGILVHSRHIVTVLLLVFALGCQGAEVDDGCDLPDFSFEGESSHLSDRIVSVDGTFERHCGDEIIETIEPEDMVDKCGPRGVALAEGEWICEVGFITWSEGDEVVSQMICDCRGLE